MSEDIKQDRSPRSPKIPLEDAIATTKRFYDKAGRSSVQREVAVKAMGYAGLNGASLTSLATLSQYGLLEKDGGNVKVSQLALKIFHPTDQDEMAKAIRESALAPSVFKSIFDSHNGLSEDVLANHLIHQGFTQDASKKAASVYKENSKFAKLDENAIIKNADDPKSEETTPTKEMTSPTIEAPLRKAPLGAVLSELIIPTNELPVPVGDSLVARIPYPISDEDFTLLLATLNLWKPKIVKKGLTFPIVATWKNKDFDKPVTIVGEMGAKDGVKYFKSKDGTGIPEPELTFEQ